MALKRKAEEYEKDVPDKNPNSSPHKKQAVEEKHPTRSEFRDGLFDASILTKYTENYASSQPYVDAILYSVIHLYPQ